ncbi:GerAB/ArcD/ProY family transporter [Alkalihalobacillus sp. LMS39]|uniref:GerAB/ArcD/ProY family transporter n=1 Tax=Alkalihalobacillus sp. LMS39 TaxID=2924032 RepID=UPI001FB54952|nr:GerAB/ArcD/ProY family transporter [Alkalihalobacillus sp. LMS39]UOE94351.1 spore germination protein [Alkalihalobacillus sp. LMS39]
MKTVKKTLKSFDLFSFTIASTISIGIAFLPYVAGEEIRSAWLKLIVTAIPYFGFLFLIHLFIKTYQDGDFFGELQQAVWKPVYYIIVIYLFCSIIYAGSVALTGMSIVVGSFLLPNIDRWIYIFLFLVVVAVGVYYGLAAISRFVVMTVTIEVVILVVIIMLGFNENFRWIYIPPVTAVDMTVLIKSSISDMARYGGLVTLLGIIGFVHKPENVFKATSGGLVFVVVTYVALALVVLGTFGYEESLHLTSPFIALVQSFGTDTGVFERLDLLFLSFWIIVFYKIVIVHVWFLLYMTKKSIPNVNGKLTILGICSLLFIITISSPPIIDEYWRIHHMNTIVYSFILPSLCLLYLIVKKKRNEST